MLSENHKMILMQGAASGLIPSNIVCPGQCKFCYETKFSKLFPWIKTIYMPRYTHESFAFYLKAYEYFGRNSSTCARALVPGGPKKVGKELHYYPYADFFSLGLTNRQIEKLIQDYKRRKKCLTIYTTGLNADFKLLKYLAFKYAGFFRFHLSIITFNLQIRERLMNPDIDMANLKKICMIAFKSTFFFIFFNKRQMIKDINIVNEFTLKNKGNYYIHKLYYNKLAPKYIANYAIKTEKEFKDFVFYLYSHGEEFKNISQRLAISPDSRIYAYRWRDQIVRALHRCKGNDNEVIFCSHGVYDVIRRHFRKKAPHLVKIKSCFGGNIDFTMGITIRSIFPKINRMLAKGVRINHIYIPSSIFHVNGEYDLNGDNINLFKHTFPELKITVIKIPSKIINSVVSLNDCVKYYLYHKIFNKEGL